MNSNVYTAMHCTCPVPAPGCILVQPSRTLLSGSMLMTLSSETEEHDQKQLFDTFTKQFSSFTFYYKFIITQGM